MSAEKFDANLRDSQGTHVQPVAPDKFDFEKYQEYELLLLEENKNFDEAETGVAVYRRFRVPEVFADGCRDMKHSLMMQLGALQASMNYKADIANFLEPWYGIGTVASSFGVDYIWEPGQAPAMKPPFTSVDEALKRDVIPVEETAIGKHTLNMIDYFLEQTQGQLPMSPTDTQAALNAASFLMDTNTFFTEMIMNPDGMKELLRRITDVTIDFTKKQADMIGEAMVLPGHGFASSRVFSGIGMSSDVISMISNEHYMEFEAPNLQRAGHFFGGAVFHSCGNWSGKIEGVKSVNNLVTIDAAFSAQTDPDPNPCEPFADQFANTGIILNARIVGDENTIVDKVEKLWQPGMKLIVVTYCATPEEQAQVYDRIHSVCGGDAC